MYLKEMLDQNTSHYDNLFQISYVSMLGDSFML